MTRTAVYILADSVVNHYKIGLSTNPDTRSKTLQSEGNRCVLYAHAWFQTGAMAMTIERSLHEQFSNYRLEGEWFRLSESQLTYLVNLMKFISPDDFHFSGIDLKELRLEKVKAATQPLHSDSVDFDNCESKALSMLKEALKSEKPAHQYSHWLTPEEYANEVSVRVYNSAFAELIKLSQCASELILFLALKMDLDNMVDFVRKDKEEFMETTKKYQMGTVDNALGELKKAKLIYSLGVRGCFLVNAMYFFKDKERKRLDYVKALLANQSES